MKPCDPKEYQHLLYDKRKFKGRVEDSISMGSYHFYILKSAPPEEQSQVRRNHYHVALLFTGELVCVRNGYISLNLAQENALYIGEGVVHHNEYW